MTQNEKILTYSVLGVIGAFGIYCIIQRFNKNPKVWYKDLSSSGKQGKTFLPFGIMIDKNLPEHDVIKDGYLTFGKDTVLKHEMTHWNQFRKEGYLIHQIKTAYYNKKYDYLENPYEIEALKSSGQWKYINKTK